MAEQVQFLEKAYDFVYISALVFLILMVFICLVRAIRGPRIADRIVAINMMGTMIMVIIAVLSMLMKEGYLLDISLIYAMISFLAVVIMTKIYLGVYAEKKKREEEEHGSH